MIFFRPGIAPWYVVRFPWGRSPYIGRHLCVRAPPGQRCESTAPVFWASVGVFSSPEGNALRSESCGKVHLRAVFLCEGKSKCRACSCSLCHPREPKTTQARDKQTTTFHVCKNRLCATNQKTLRFSASARNDKKTIQQIAPRWCAVLEASLLPALTLVCGFCPLCHFLCS